MSGVNATELAGLLGISKSRVSHYVGEGKLDGCYQGDGRSRRFNLEAVGARLNRVLHPGQMLGNGAGTRRALKTLPHSAASDQPTGTATPEPSAVLSRGGAGLGSEAGPKANDEPDRYETARTIEAEQRARRALRDNEAAEGTYVLASEVERTTARLMAQEIAEIDMVLKHAARRVADRMGVDFRTVRGHLVDVWRESRAVRERVLSAQADNATLTDGEAAADI